MEERYGTVSRWIMALAVLFIPLSIIVLVSGPWSYNFQTQANQWTRYLLFISWILVTLAIIAGIASLLSPMAEEKEEEKTEVKRTMTGEGEGEETEEESKVILRPKSKMSMGFTMLMSQAVLFSLGIILYVVYISWLIVPAVSTKLLTGG